MASPLPYRREDGLEFRVLTPDLAEQAMAIEVQGFADEPCVGTYMDVVACTTHMTHPHAHARCGAADAVIRRV